MTETAASTRVPVSIQLIGGPTARLEIGCLRLLTDPALDAPGPFPSGDRTLTKTTGPAVAAEEIGPIDAVLLSHDQHGDNLDRSGRALLAHADVVLTTPEGADRLGRGVADDTGCGSSPPESALRSAPFNNRSATIGRSIRSTFMSSEQKVAIITGASQGIGAGAVQAYRKLGSAVVANSRHITSSADPDMLTVPGDIADPETGARLVDRVVEHFGQVDTLVTTLACS
jgi:hypothetical protein